MKCPECKSQLYRAEIEKNLFVCNKCDHHMRISARDRLNQFLDQASQSELFPNIISVDPLNFEDTKKYKDRLTHSKEVAGESDALLVMEGTLNSIQVVACAFEFKFLGGSMGSVVGELVSRSIDLSREKKIPFIIVCTSGGARMQESALSLMQLAKTSSKLARFQDEGGLFIPILTDPTTGGVTASFGMLGDIILAEPGALIGFAGPRVIKQTIGENLPEGFQRAEFLQDKGFVDHIVPRENLKETISNLISMLTS